MAKSSISFVIIVSMYDVRERISKNRKIINLFNQFRKLQLLFYIITFFLVIIMIMKFFYWPELTFFTLLISTVIINHFVLNTLQMHRSRVKINKIPMVLKCRENIMIIKSKT